jgi:hypothetical protein
MSRHFHVRAPHTGWIMALASIQRWLPGALQCINISPETLHVLLKAGIPWLPGIAIPSLHTCWERTPKKVLRLTLIGLLPVLLIGTACRHDNSNPSRTFTLMVMMTGSGTGTVTSSPRGIDCGHDCSETYPKDTQITLTGIPGPGSTFASWSGACSGTAGCTVTMDADKTVTATFPLQTFTLTVTKAGTGNGTVISSPVGIDCGTDCSEAYASGTVVSLEAQPDPASLFAGWSGSCVGTGSCAVAMNAAQSVTALFTADLTEFPILDPRLAFAAPRHIGEGRVGSTGTVNKRPEKTRAELQPVCEGRGRDIRCVLRFEYAFQDTADPEEFVGVFITLGRIGISTTNPDCTRGPDLDLHADSTFDLTNLFQTTRDIGISIESLRLVLRPDGRVQTLTLRVELEDAQRRKMFLRVPLDSRGTDSVVVDLPLSNFQGAMDLRAVKLVSLIVEELHVADRIVNPPGGSYDIEFVAFLDEDGPRLDAAFIASLDDRAMIAELAQRDFETLLRLIDAVTGASLDRTLFRDLIHWGATGWLLAALPAAVQQGWITIDDAQERALWVLRFLDDDTLWGDEPIGKVGNSQGMVYRFGGPDPTGLDGPLTGTRKLDVGDCNAVEASVIDTALLHWGAATLAAGFSSADLRDREIGERVSRLLNRTRWGELVDPKTGQLQLAWKPELDDTPPGCFTAPAPFGGFWASRAIDSRCPGPAEAQVLTIDFWTDEGAMAAILAAGSESHPASTGTWYRMLRTFGKGVGADVVVTFPGAWFTYTFLTATYLPQTLGPDRGEACEAAVSLDLTKNAERSFMAFDRLSPGEDPVLPDAVELPDANYIAQGKPEVAADPQPPFTGTITPWSLQLVMGLDDMSAARAIAALRRILREQPELWDPLLGLLDSYHPNLADFVTALPQHGPMVRTEGRWVQQQVWPLNKGAALLAQLNFLDDDAVRRIATQHPVIQRGIARIYGERSGQIGTPGGHDWWSIAIDRDTILIPDGFQEQLVVFDDFRRSIGIVSREAIQAALDQAPFCAPFVERSPGPAGVRDAVVHPDGDWIVLIAGPGKDVLLRVHSDLTLAVQSCNFGEAMSCGDEIGNFPRIAVGGSPAAILVTVNSPQLGIAVVGMDGVLIHTLPLGQSYHGIAVEPETNRLYLLRANGTVERYDDLYNKNLSPIPSVTLPVPGRDLAYSTSWRTTSPALIAVGGDGRVYAIDLATGNTQILAIEGLEGVMALDIAQGLAAFARDETAWLDDGCE